MSLAEKGTAHKAGDDGAVYDALAQLCIAAAKRQRRESRSMLWTMKIGLESLRALPKDSPEYSEAKRILRSLGKWTQVYRKNYLELASAEYREENLNVLRRLQTLEQKAGAAK